MEKETTKELTPAPPVPSATQGQEVNGKTPEVRTASKEEFKKAQEKTSKQHSGLFRRLAK